tara:strand:- start:482 stop:601 length:120 start_codon:yes stop_codon:yes gene_type:complete
MNLSSSKNQKLKEHNLLEVDNLRKTIYQLEKYIFNLENA